MHGRCVVLDDRERKSLIEIERRLLSEDPDLARLFWPAPTGRAPEKRGGAVITRVAVWTLWVVLLTGPHPLTETEIATRMTAGPATLLQMCRWDGRRGSISDTLPATTTCPAPSATSSSPSTAPAQLADTHAGSHPLIGARWGTRRFE